MIFQDSLIIEAEQSLLGIFLAMPNNIPDVIGIVSNDDFLLPIHGDIFNACIEMFNDGEQISPVRISPKFQNREDMEESYLPELAASVFSSVNLVSYAKSIHDAAEKRRFIYDLEDILSITKETGDIESLRADIISRLSDNSISTVTKTNSEALGEVIKALQRPSDCDKTSIKKLDNAMAGGLYSGFLYGFAGAEKSGKTTTAQTISYNLNQGGVKHAYIALEMGSTQIEQRNLARAMGVNSLKFLETPQKDFIKQASYKAAKMPNNTIYADMAGCNFQQVKSEVMRLVNKHNIKGFIVDYWQLIGCDNHKQNKSDFLFEVAQWCAAFCKRNKVWCILLSQLNRDGKILGSAGLERACDQLYIISQAEDFYNKGLSMSMTHSRYTRTLEIGTDDNPAFRINFNAGPYLEEI